MSFSQPNAATDKAFSTARVTKVPERLKHPRPTCHFYCLAIDAIAQVDDRDELFRFFSGPMATITRTCSKGVTYHRSGVDSGYAGLLCFAHFACLTQAPPCWSSSSCLVGLPVDEDVTTKALEGFRAGHEAVALHCVKLGDETNVVVRPCSAHSSYSDNLLWAQHIVLPEPTC